MSATATLTAAAAVVTNNATVGGTLGVTGLSTLNSAAVTTNATVGGALDVTGLSTLNSAAVTTNATVGGTLDVTGLSTLNSAAVTTNATVGGTLDVTGTTTTAAIALSGKAGSITRSGTGALDLDAITGTAVPPVWKLLESAVEHSGNANANAGTGEALIKAGFLGHTSPTHGTWQRVEYGYIQYANSVKQVFLRGLVVEASNGAIAASTTLLTLPSGYRPLAHRTFVTTSHVNANTNAGMRIDVEDTGDVICQSTGISQYAALGGISFWTN